MSATGLEVFDHTFQTTNIWLNEIEAHVGPDRRLAWKVLTTVLQNLRDQLQPDLAAHLSAQLPLLVRGGYYDRYQPSKMQHDAADREDFVEAVARGLKGSRGVDPRVAVAAVFETLERHVSAGELKKVRNALRKDVRALWPSDNAA